MEVMILMDLDYDLSPPISLQFLRRLTKKCQVDQKAHNLAKYFMESSLLDSNLSQYRPSLTAAACMFLSLTILKDHSNMLKIEGESGYKLEELMPFMMNIPKAIQTNKDKKFEAVYNKFAGKALGGISCWEELSSDEFINLTYFSC
uniref:G2/mitotic-specific cyclin-B2 (Trinotate prediction) n=1 Tax=Henneguya salminicola TaxID=69463 RepID=A0A6G3MH29_HENSL